MKCKILLITLLMSVFIVPLHGGNVQNSFSGQLAECAVDSAKVAEDSSSPTAKEKFSLAHSLRKANKYDEAIKEAKAGQELCADTHSKLYAQLMQIEGMCLIERESDWHNIDFDRLASLIKNAYEIYKALDVTDSWMMNACYILCNLAAHNSRYYRSFECYEYSVCLMQHNYDPLFALKMYAGALIDRYRDPSVSLKEIDKAIYEEKQKMADCEIVGISYILDYIHGSLYSWGYLDGKEQFFRPDNGPELAVKYFESAISGLGCHDDIPYCLRYKCKAYRDLADYYYQIGHLSLAADNYSKSLAISREYWEVIEFDSPWIESFQSQIFGFNEYTDCLLKLDRQDEVLEYYNQVIADLDKLELNDLNYHYIEQVRNWTKEAIIELQNKTSDDIEVSDDVDDNHSYYPKNSILRNVIEEYEKGNTTIDFSAVFKIPFDDLYLDAWVFSRFLFNNNDYRQLIVFGERFLQRYYSRLDLSGDDVFKDWPDVYENSKDKLFDSWRRWYAVDDQTIPGIHNFLAMTYFQNGNFNQALHHELQTHEVFRTDSKFLPQERGNLLRILSYGYFGVEVLESLPWSYFKIEKTTLFSLGAIYCELRKYREAYDTYLNILNLNREILAASLSTGDSQYKYSIWEDLKDDFENIFLELDDCIEDYPRFSELVMECNAMYDTFWGNYNVSFDEAAKNASRESQQALNARKSAEQDLEFSNYTSRIKREDCLADIDNAVYQLNKSVDSKSVVSRSIVSVDDLRKHLRANDIAVDFQEVYYKNDTTSHYLRSTGSGSNMRRTFVNHLNPHVYANIMRSTWTSPKRVYLGDFSKDVAFNNRKWVDYVYYMRDGQEAPDIYKNEGLAKFFWSKIIEAADIKEGENIYFVPSNISDNIAIEYLPYKGETINSRYNISRISSLLQIGEKEHLFMATDKCVAFGGISDYGGMGSVRVNEGKNMSGDARCIVDRNYLPSLRETEALIKTVESSVPNIQPKLGYAATKQEFMKLDGNSPNILVLATHGFNFKEADLDKAQQEALFGNREEADLSSMEKGLLTSGLYLANPKGGSVLPIEGMLTARDVSMMNLNNVDVAILVGCSSAIGLNGEDGSYGLVRALKMAGVKTVIGALWDVDVEATRLLFQKFFGYYTRGLNCRDAMKKAQDDVKNTTVNDGMQRISYQNPYYWAGFVVID